VLEFSSCLNPTVFRCPLAPYSDEHMSTSHTACGPAPTGLRSTHSYPLNGSVSSSGGHLQGALGFCRRAPAPRCSAARGSERGVAPHSYSAPAADRGAGAPAEDPSGPITQHIVPFRTSTTTSSSPTSGTAAAGTELGAAEGSAALRAGIGACPTWPTAAARQGLYSDVPVDRVSPR
jgi:hypothetical protein